MVHADSASAEPSTFTETMNSGTETESLTNSGSMTSTSIARDISAQADRMREMVVTGVPVFPRDVPRIAALPGIGGFDVQTCLLAIAGRPCDLSAAQILAEEADDPSWSRTMESRIISETSRLYPAEITQLYTVCRSTICGVVIGSAVRNPFSSSGIGPAGGSDVRDAIGDALAEALGMEFYSSKSEVNFTAIYFRNAE
jgi:hypothetical protein